MFSAVLGRTLWSTWQSHWPWLSHHSDACLEAYAKLQRLDGEKRMSCTQAYEWHKRFEEKMSILTNFRGDTDPAELRKFFADICAPVRGNSPDPRQWLWDDVQISYDSVMSVINEDLTMRHVSANLASARQPADQNRKPISVTQSLHCVENFENYLKTSCRPLSSNNQIFAKIWCWFLVQFCHYNCAEHAVTRSCH